MNMSYCRFRNTVEDLIDCAENFFEVDRDDEEEMRARARLFRVCRNIVEMGIENGEFEE